MERLAATTRVSPPCGAVFTPRPCASKRPSNSRLYARSTKRVAPSDDGKLRSAVLGTFAGAALSFGVFVGGVHADEGLMTSPFQERNQQKLEAAEESFQNSDILKELKARSEANRSANKRAIEDKYCFRQAEMGVGDCGGLRFLPDFKFVPVTTTTTGLQNTGLQNAPEFLKKLFGNFFNDLKEIVAPTVEEELDEELAAFEAELAETVKVIEAIEKTIVAEPTKPAESAETKESTKAPEPVKSAESVETKESTEAVESVKSEESVKESTESAPPKEAEAPQKSTEAVESKQSDPVEEKSSESVEVVKSPEAVEPEQAKEVAESESKESVVPVISSEAVETEKSTESAEPVKLPEAVEPVKVIEVVAPVKTTEAVEPVKLAATPEPSAAPEASTAE